MGYLQSLGRCDASSVAASSLAPALAEQKRALPFWAMAETQERPRLDGRGNTACASPSASLQLLLLLSKEDPPQKYSTKQTKVYFFSEVCYQECVDQKEIGHEIWANRGRNREVYLFILAS